ncbi:MAG: hypothetical protein AAFQ66_01835 [Pseudomonadota bacterium]
MLRRIISFFGAFGLFCGIANAEPISYPPDAEVRRETEVPMQSSQLTALDEFLSRPDYFGAFAVAGDGAYGWFSRANDIETARDYALTYCESYQPVGSEFTCIVVATTVPRGFDGPGNGTLRHKAGADLWALKTDRRFAGARALAASGSGAYGFVYNRPSSAGAERDALQICEQYNSKTDVILPRSQCKVLWVSR